MAIWRYAADDVKPAPGPGPRRVRRVQRGAQRIAAAVRAAHGGWPGALVSLASTRQGPDPGAADRQANSCALAQKVHTVQGTQNSRFCVGLLWNACAGPDQRNENGQGQPPSACQRQTRATQGTGGDALQRTPADKRHPDAGINLIRYEGLG